MARITSWRRVNDGWVCRIKPHYYYGNSTELDVSFYIKSGTNNEITTKYPKLMMVGLKNNKIDRSNVILSIYCNSSLRAKDLVDHIMILAMTIEKNGIPADSVLEWIKMQMQLIDTKLAREMHDPNVPRRSYYRTF